MSLRRALRESDWPWVAGFVRGRFAVDVTPEWLAARCPVDELKYLDGRSPWSEGTCVMWLKNRVANLLPFGGGAPDEIEFPCEMNVGFIHIVETPEMRDRLARGETVRSAARPRRSRITKTSARIHPVNRVADRVLHVPAQKEATP